jgi:hypothetical protein
MQTGDITWQASVTLTGYSPGDRVQVQLCNNGGGNCTAWHSMQSDGSGGFSITANDGSSSHRRTTFQQYAVAPNGCNQATDIILTSMPVCSP